MDVIIATAIIAAVVGLAIGIVAGYFTRKNISEAKIGEADSLAKNIIDQANKDAETMKKEKLLEAKEEIHKFRSDAEKENRERRTPHRIRLSVWWQWLLLPDLERIPINLRLLEI